MQEEMDVTLFEVMDEVEGATAYMNYSGRGMYGRTCIGFDLEQGLTPMAFFGAVLEGLEDAEADDREMALSALAVMMRDARTDSLGLGTILYFPSFKTPD